MSWLENTEEVSAEAQLWVGTAIEDLVLADRTLAQTAIDDARAGTTSDPEAQLMVDELLDSAEELMQFGDRDASSGFPTEAIRAYMSAWLSATEAMDHQ